MEIHVDSEYLRNGAAAPANITLRPANRDGDIIYSVQGDAMTLAPVCPPNASCIIPQFTHYTRQHAID